VEYERGLGIWKKLQCDILWSNFDGNTSVPYITYQHAERRCQFCGQESNKDHRIPTRGYWRKINCDEKGGGVTGESKHMDTEIEKWKKGYKRKEKAYKKKEKEYKGKRKDTMEGKGYKGKNKDKKGRERIQREDKEYSTKGREV
jgi:hypothetical protein